MNAKIKQLFGQVLAIVRKIAWLAVTIIGSIIAYLVLIVVIAQGMEAVDREAALELESASRSHHNAHFGCAGAEPTSSWSFWHLFDSWGKGEDCRWQDGGCYDNGPDFGGRWGRRPLVHCEVN